MPAKLPYRIVESNLLYQGHIIRLVKDRFILNAVKNKVVTRELVEHPGAVAVIPFADMRVRRLGTAADHSSSVCTSW